MEPPALKQTQKKARALAVTAILSLLVFAILVELLARPNRSLLHPFEALLFRYLIYAMSTVLLGAVIFMARRFLKPTSEHRTSASSTRQRQVHEDRTEEDNLAILCARRQFSLTLLVFAMAESITVYGFLLSILLGTRTDFYLLSGTAFGIMVWFFPTLSRWKERYERQRLAGYSPQNG